MSFGPLVKAKETLKVFVRSAPSPRTLLANRVQSFDQLHVILPSTTIPGERLPLTVQAWDQCERLDGGFDGSVTVATTDPDGHTPDTISFSDRTDGIFQTDDIEFHTPGIQYLLLRLESSGERFVSNPVRVAEHHQNRVYWGDIHLHSTLSDGVGAVKRGYRYGRDVMDLDVVAYTDHDTMGFFIPPSWQRKRMHGEYFEQLCDLAEEFNEDGAFVTLPAYEWTKQPNMGGHINVYFERAEDARLFDSLGPDSRSYEALWDRLREWDENHESGVVTVPHHPAESMYPFDFANTAYDDDYAPLVEVYSQWGSSEQPGDAGNPFPLEMGQGEIDQPGYYVADAHRLGYKVGMIGGSDFHGPYPGHSIIHTQPHLPSLSEWRQGGLGWGNIWRVWDERSYPGGLTAFLAPELTRQAIFEAMQSRSVYATTQPHRILVDFRVNGESIEDQTDAVIVESQEAPRKVAIEVAGTAPIDAVEILKNNEVWQTINGTEDPEAAIECYTVSGEWTDETSLTGMSWDEQRETAGVVYSVRVRQASDGAFPGMAWIGPLWVESAG